MNSLKLVTRNFDLKGVLAKNTLHKGRRILEREFISKLNDKSLSKNYKDELREVIKILLNESLSGNEAGVSIYQSFAPTEIEEALKRLDRGQHIDYLVYRHRWHNCPHNFIVPDFPIHLGIESTSRCDLKCKMCFQTDPAFYRNRCHQGDMNFGLYKKIIDEGAQKGLKSVKLSVRGEPLLHKELPLMISYAREMGILDVMLNTNANILTVQRAREILGVGPTLVVFSVDSMQKSRFEDIRKGANFEKIINNIEAFLKIKKNEFSESLTKTRVQMTVIPEAIEDIEGLKEYWDGKVDEIAIKNALTRIYKNPVKLNNPCRTMWQRLDIHWNGDVWLCDNDYLGKLMLGNVNTQTIEEIWKSDKLHFIRGKHKNGEKNDINPCRYCDGL